MATSIDARTCQWQRALSLSWAGLGAAGAWVLAGEQPRAVGAGKRGLGRPARDNASAAAGAARGGAGPGSHRRDRQSGWAGYRLEGGGGRRTVMRVVPGSISW